jgi:rsbT co-antagonist protein RsbR
MWKRLRSWLNNIPVSNPLERQQAALFQIFLLINIVAGLLGLIASPLSAPAGSLISFGTIAYVLITAWNTSMLFLLRRGYFRLSVLLEIIVMTVAFGFILIATGIARGQTVLLTFSVPIAIGGLVLGRKGMLITTGLSSVFVILASVLAIVAPSMTGFTASASQESSPVSTTVSYILIVGVLGLCLDRFGNSLRMALTDMMARERELEHLRATLEETVDQRTASLQQALQDVAQREARLTQTLMDLRTSEKTIRELGAPVIPVLPGVLVAPLIGILDSDRAATLADNVLAMVERERASQVIFDITGVPLVDTQVAHVLLETTNAVRLLGAQTLIVGIRPEVAQTIISLGLDFTTIATFPNLQEAVTAIMNTRANKHLNGATRLAGSRIELEHQ